MKRKILATLLCGCFIAAALSGCGEDSSTALENGTVNIEENPAEEPAENSAEETSEESEQETEGETEAESEEAESENEEEPASDWFTEHGLVITPQGDFTYNTMAYDSNREDLELFPVKANVVITETTDGVEDGYKQVRIVVEKDASALYDVEMQSGWRSWSSTFDRYTGFSFAADSTSSSIVAIGGALHKEGFITIINGDESYDVSTSFEAENNHPYYTEITTVICPVDYDGVVFYTGPDDSEKREANSQIDYGARLYTIDELLYYGEGYYYFSCSNQ